VIKMKMLTQYILKFFGLSLKQVLVFWIYHDLICVAPAV
jgi:hypothetical protein